MNKFVKTISVAACVVLSATAAAVSACNPEAEAELTSLKLETANVKTAFTVGESFSAEGLEVKGVYSDNSEKSITDYDLKAYCGDAVVDIGAEFTVAGQYTAKVTCQQKEASYALTVNPAPAAEVKVESVTLSESSLSLEVGGTATLTATVNPENATDKTVVWTSSSDETASVSEGVVTAKAAGHAVITATAGGKSATCEVEVTAPVTDTRVHVSNAADLADALKNDCDIVLDGNVETDEHFTVDHTVSIDLNGKTVTQTAEKQNALFEVTGKLTIKGDGSVTAKHYVFRVGEAAAASGEIVLESGNYTTSSASVLYVVRGSAEIKGGDYSVTYSNDKWLINGYDSNLADIEITVTGGTFHGFDPSDETISDCTIPGEYICKKASAQDSANKDVYTVSALQVIEAGNLSQLKEALADDCVIKLTANIEDADERLEIAGKHIVLDLNGKTLKGTVSAGQIELIWLKEGELYVKGEGTLESVNGYNVSVGSQNNGTTGKLVIESGTFKAGNAASVVQVEKGIAQIKGGEFSVTEDAYGNNYVLNCIDNKDDADIEVTGGRFYKFNPAEADNHDNGAEVKTNYVKSGYKSAADGDYYTVSAND